MKGKFKEQLNKLKEEAAELKGKPFKLKAKWLFSKIRDCWPTFIIVTAIMYSPVLVCLPLGYILNSPALISVATGYALFWAGPWTPFWPLDILITLTISTFLKSTSKR